MSSDRDIIVSIQPPTIHLHRLLYGIQYNGENTAVF